MKNLSIKIKNINQIKKWCTTLTKKGWRDLTPPPPTPRHTITHFNITGDYIGENSVVRLCIYTNETIYRNIFTFYGITNQQEVDEAIDFLTNTIKSGVYYHANYNRKDIGI